MNEIVDKFLIAFKATRIYFNACGSFIKHYEYTKKFKQTGNLNYIQRNKLDKACFAHDAAYAYHTELPKRNI